MAAQYAQPVPAPKALWQQTSLEESTAPEVSPAKVLYRFTIGDWVVTVSYSAGMSAATVYSVTLSNLITGFEWEGTVDCAGQVKELIPEEWHDTFPTCLEPQAKVRAVRLGVLHVRPQGKDAGRLVAVGFPCFDQRGRFGDRVPGTRVMRAF